MDFLFFTKKGFKITCYGLILQLKVKIYQIKEKFLLFGGIKLYVNNIYNFDLFIEKNYKTTYNRFVRFENYGRNKFKRYV